MFSGCPSVCACVRAKQGLQSYESFSDRVLVCRDVLLACSCSDGRRSRLQGQGGTQGRHVHGAGNPVRGKSGAERQVVVQGRETAGRQALQGRDDRQHDVDEHVEGGEVGQRKVRGGAGERARQGPSRHRRRRAR